MFQELLTNKDGWLNQKDDSPNIIFSSRIRLARNFSDYPFPFRATRIKKEIVLKKAEEAYSQISRLKDSAYVRMEDLSDLDRQFLLERHLISKEHTVSLRGKGLIVSSDERIAIMINEEDHLRIQVISGDDNLDLSWQLLDEIDTEFSKRIKFAFMPDIGYLTSCPTNAGTALRVSCMLRLPALVLIKRIDKILELLAKISFTARGFFGEGTAAYGDFFQVSNQVCLGVSEKELIDNLSEIVNQIKDQEDNARNILLKRYKLRIEDSVWRALGILRNSRLIDSKEALSHLSMLSLGLDLGIIKEIKRNTVNNLFIIIHPAHLQRIEGRVLKEQERDFIRAEVIREKLHK